MPFTSSRRGARCALVFALFACANHEQNASIEAMNKGVELMQVDSHASAERHLKEATTLYAENHLAWYNLGQVYVQQKKFKEAAEAFAEAVKHNGDDAMYHYRLGRSLYETNNLSLAETHLEKAVQLNDRLYKAHWYLGRVYNQTDRPQEAATAWTKSATLSPAFGPPFIDLGRLYLRWDKVGEAVSVLNQGAMHVKDRVELTDIYYYLGLAYDAQKSWNKAIEAYGKALEVKSDNMEARLQRGFAYANAGDKANARKDLEEFVKQGGGGNTFNVQAANDRLIRLALE
jgi:tetratricopeptide (TPR) repeat protein